MFGISPVDIEWTGSRIALLKDGHPRSLHKALVVYDTSVGGLRLTEPVYSRFEEILEALRMAKWPRVEALHRWFGSLVAGERGLLDTRASGPPEGWLRVLAPGSRVFIRSGQLQEAVVRRPCLINLPEYGIIDKLGYELEVPDGMRQVIDDAVEPAEDGWEMVDWNPTTGEIRPLEEG